jgi:hypothetical protein
MKDTFDLHEWNKKRYLNEGKGKEEAQKLIQSLRSSVLKKLNDEELEEFRKEFASAFDMSLKESTPLQEQQDTFNLSQLTFEQISPLFEFGGVSAPLGGDTLRKIKNKENFEDWKQEIMSKYGDVKIQLNPKGSWSSKIQILDKKFTDQQEKDIQSKERFLSTSKGSMD